MHLSTLAFLCRYKPPRVLRDLGGKNVDTLSLEGHNSKLAVSRSVLGVCNGPPKQVLGARFPLDARYKRPEKVLWKVRKLRQDRELGAFVSLLCGC